MPRMTSRPHLALILAAGLALPLSAAAAAQPAAADRPEARAAAFAARPAAEDLPLTRITLYRSGVGFFQREGLISGSTDLQLRFRTEQINDILKSMVLLDLDGGRIDGVSYGSKDPLSRRLAAFGINIADNPSIADLLGRLRGSEVSLVTVNGEVTGTILGVETRPTVVPSGGTAPPAVVNQPHLSLVTAGGIRTVPISEVSSFTLTDKELAAELNKALAALAEHRAETNKTVSISLSGPEGQARRVVAAYVHEMPIWKTSYRLILPESADDGAPGGNATLQGWAIVENTTDEDWKNVRLSLVAGRPVSFEMDLYEPLYLDRPNLPVPVVAGVAPRQYQEGANVALGKAVAVASERARQAQRRGEVGYAAAPAAPAMDMAGARDGGASPFTAITGETMVGYAAQAQAQTGSVGEVFQYELTTPVTIERQQSAMLPFVTAAIPARRVSIFNLADGSDHPMRGVEITNPAGEEGNAEGLQILPGPIAVFDGPAYAGDASISHIPAGDKRLLAYAVDLDVAALTKPEQTSTVTRLRIVDGAVEQTTKLRSTTTYGFDNKDAARGRTILVEHPRMPGWDLVEPKPVDDADGPEQTRDYYRFELELAPAAGGALSVVQERTERQTIAVTSFDLPTILAYHRQGKVSDGVLEAFRTVAAMQAAVSEAERAIALIDREVGSIRDDQSRIRANMNAIDRNSDLYRRYMTRLTEQETQLESLNTRRIEAQDALEARRAELHDYLRNLTVE